MTDRMPNDRATPRTATTGGAHDPGRAPLTVGLLLWPSFPLMSLTGVVESLRHAADHGDASRQRYAVWHILGPPGSRVVSSCGIAVETTAPYPRPGALDCLFVIGGLLRDLDSAPAAHRACLRAARQAGTRIVGVCTGSFVLAAEGLLDGCPVGVHPYHHRDFRTAFPNHRITVNRDYVEAGQVVTVLGGVCILSYMAQLIAAHLGPDRSAKTVHQMTLPNPEGPAPPDHGTRAPRVQITDPRIQKALVILEAQATQNPSIASLASTLGMSERHLLRLFRAELGRSPKEYLVEMKLRAAVWMLRHTTRSITAIAYATGFASGANLADHCRRRLGSTPTALRQSASSPEGAAAR